MRDTWHDYGFPVAVVAACTTLAFGMFPFFELTNLVMLYLLGTLVVALRGHRGAAALSSVASVFCFDFFFVHPRFTFSVDDAQYIWTMVVMFIVSMTISHLTILLKEEAERVRAGEQRTTWLMEKAKKSEIEAESERMRSTLLSSVSHDLKTPLAAILGSASTLVGQWETLEKVRTQELLENIQLEGERLSRLVQNLLEVTRLESGAIQLNKELYPLEEVLGSALERLKKPLFGRIINTDLPEDLPPVPIDALLVEQVFINLLENAIRHTPERAPIDIQAKHEGDRIHVSIADRGPGLGNDELERVFDKFYHSSGSPGAGLGLAICRAIVKAHGGTITAVNRPGGGAVFRFTIPSSPTVSGHG